MDQHEEMERVSIDDDGITFKIKDSYDLSHKRNISLQSNLSDVEVEYKTHHDPPRANQILIKIRNFLTSPEFKKSCRPTFTLMISILFSLVPHITF